MNKNDLQKNRGKRVKEKTPTKGVFKIYVWDETLKRYRFPKSNLMFYALRYEPNSDGERKRASKCFSNMKDAKRWQQFEVVEDSTKNYQTFREMKQRRRLVLKKDSKGQFSKNYEESKIYIFSQLYEDFKFKKFPFIGTATQRNYEAAYKNMKFLYSYQVNNINPNVIDEWIGFLKNPRLLKKYKSSRCNFDRELDALKFFFNWYIDYNRISNWNNPVKKSHYEMARIKPKINKGRRYMYQEQKEQWYEVLKKYKPEFYYPAFIQTEQAMRVSETFAMKWENLNLERKEYLISGRMIWDRVKKQDPYIELGTKTQKEGFVMPLRASVVKLLEELKKQASSPYIFHNQGKLWSYKHIQNAYEYAFKKANLPFSGTHVCRHTGATLFLNETQNPLALQELCNWTNQKQALHYGKILKQTLRDAIDKADNVTNH